MFSLFVILVTFSSGDARAQETASALRERQTVLFDAMRGDPQNLGLMFDYAGVSARLEDYEAAISTLERMLIFNADLPRVRLELGALYFRIGSYAAAERYFATVAQSPDLPEPVRRRIGRFRAEIEKRNRRHHFSGRVELAAIYDSNASLGPQNRNVLLFGGAARVPDESLGEGDVGGRFLAEASHRYDFGEQGNEFWQTDAAFFGRRYQDVDLGASEAFFLRTGPQFSLDDLYFGPNIRPFVDVTHVRVDDDPLYLEGGIGFEFRSVLGDEWSTFASARAATRRHEGNRDDEDGEIIDLRSGVAWTPVRDLSLTAAIGSVHDLADADYERNTEGSLRLTASFAYDPGLAIAGDKWQLSAYVAGTYRKFDAPDPEVTSTETRRDIDLRTGVQHLFNFDDGFYASLGVSALRRNSNIANFELRNVGVSAAVGYSF